ncbi:MAG: SDR family oxidoreductase [Candidatus Marinamargulisbacteria bacterium]
MNSVIITGANRGIGLALATQLSVDHTVYALCRTSSNELQTLKNTHIIKNVDVSCTASIHSASKKIEGPVHGLINNAGILNKVSIESLNESELNHHWNINAMGPLRVFTAFQNHLVSGSKLLFITSRMGSITDNTSGSHYAYRMSKAALNMAAKSLSIDLKPQNISVGIVHPGWVKTDMTSHTGHCSTHESAQNIINRLHALNLSNTGTFWHANGNVLEW